MFMLRMELLVAASSVADVCNQITALVADALVCVSVRSREAATGGQMVLVVAEMEPLMVTQSAPFKTISPEALVPVIVVPARVGLDRRGADHRTTTMFRPRFNFIAVISTCSRGIMTGIRRDIWVGR